MAADLVIQRIGGATQAVVALGTGYGASKGTRFRVATGAVANGAAVAPSTYLNRSGRAMVAGEGVWAVAP
jgi:peptidyl-tRNA hydrolase